MRSLRLVLVIAAVLLPVSMPSIVIAQPAQASYLISLNWFNLQVTYPSEVNPGDTLNVSVQGTPNSASVYLQTLNVTVYYGDATGLHQLNSEALVSNAANVYAYYGQPTTGSFSRSFTVNVPQNAPRTSLIAVFSETAQINNYYNNYYYGPYPFSYWSYGNPLFYSYYPTYTTSTDQGISPLSYIKATTPEFVSLQAEYNTLRQQLNQTQTQNQQLEITITEQAETISQLNQQVASANTTAQSYEAIAAVFIIISVGLTAFSIYQIRRKSKARDMTQP